MKRFAFALLAAASLAGPVSTPAAAQSLTVLLPSLSFPDPVVTTSTMNCETKAQAQVCRPAE